MHILPDIAFIRTHISFPETKEKRERHARGARGSGARGEHNRFRHRVGLWRWLMASVPVTLTKSPEPRRVVHRIFVRSSSAMGIHRRLLCFLVARSRLAVLMFHPWRFFFGNAGSSGPHEWIAAQGGAGMSAAAIATLGSPPLSGSSSSSDSNPPEE